MELNGNIKSWAAQKVEATKEREIENADYEKEHVEYTENIDALSAAMATIAASTQPVSALLQDANSDLMVSLGETAHFFFVSSRSKSLVSQKKRREFLLKRISCEKRREVKMSRKEASFHSFNFVSRSG